MVMNLATCFGLTLRFFLFSSTSDDLCLVFKWRGCTALFPQAEICDTHKRQIKLYVHIYIYVYVCSVANTISRLALDGETFCMRTI
jgi:hypothetical protein